LLKDFAQAFHEQYWSVSFGNVIVRFVRLWDDDDSAGMPGVVAQIEALLKLGLDVFWVGSISPFE
jgi:hypothetical protein